VVPAGYAGGGRGREDLAEPGLPAVRIVLAPEQREHRQAGQVGAQGPLDLGHDRVDPQHSGQDL